MTDNQLIDQLATDAYVHSSGVAKYPATIIYKASIQQLKEICEAYHQAKCGESKPVAECVTNPFGENTVCAFKWIDDNYKPKLGDKLFTTPQPFDAEAKLKLAIEALKHIAIKQAKDGQAKYAIAKQALEKID